MKFRKGRLVTLIISIALASSINAQDNNKVPEMRYNFNEDGSHYLKGTGLNQVWLRYTNLNPGSSIYGQSASNIADIGIRRLRFQLYGQLTDRVFFYAQFGQNNFSFLQPRYTGSFFHDAITEFSIPEIKVSVGAGLTAWGGFLRYSQPSVGSIMSLDAPLYQQATNGVNDQFLRKLAAYFKGQAGRFNYRIAVIRPLAVQNGGVTAIKNDHSDFSLLPARPQYAGYFKYQLLDKESNTIPYETGTYLGKKKVFNIGGGFAQQSNAMWWTNAAGDTVQHSMLLAGIDIFYDSPIAAEKMAITFYGAYSYTDFGNKYLRNVGVMNPANGTGASATLNGTGNGFPMIGTGSTYYAQAGLLFGKNVITEGGKLQPYVASQYSVFKALGEPMIMAEGGLNWYIHGLHNAKVTANYQSRPIFSSDANGNNLETSRLGMFQIQYQIAF